MSSIARRFPGGRRPTPAWLAFSLLAGAACAPETAGPSAVEERAISTALAIEGEVLRVRAVNPAGAGATLVAHISGQVARTILPTLQRTERVGPASATELTVPLADLGVVAADDAIRLGVRTATTYDDGRTDAGYAGSTYFERVAGAWRENPAPVVDRTAIVREETPDPASSSPLPEGTLAATGTKFCFREKNVFVDAGVGEDLWNTTSEVYRPAIGLQVHFACPHEVLAFVGLDFNGCAENIVLPSTQTCYANIFSAGEIGSAGGSLPPRSARTSSVGSIRVQLPSVAPPQQTIQFDPGPQWEAFQIVNVALYALRASPGPSTALQEYVFQPGASTSSAGNPIRIQFGKGNRKWLITHFLGLRFISVNAPNVNWDALTDYSVADTDPDCASTATNLTMSSKEYVGVAYREALGAFYGALTFNFADPDANCFVEGGANCKSAYTGVPLAHMETSCPGNGTTDLTGRGTKIDWLRQLWRVRTGSTTATNPTFNQMIGWLGPLGISTTRVYSSLEFSANAYGGTLNANWDANKLINGVDH
jgi:hypothetical protein